MSKEIVKTSINQPRELWNLVKTDAIKAGKKNDEILTEILRKHYGISEKTRATHGEEFYSEIGRNGGRLP